MARTRGIFYNIGEYYETGNFEVITDIVENNEAPELTVNAKEEKCNSTSKLEFIVPTFDFPEFIVMDERYESSVSKKTDL